MDFTKSTFHYRHWAHIPNDTDAPSKIGFDIDEEQQAVTMTFNGGKVRLYRMEIESLIEGLQAMHTLLFEDRREQV